jgi:hypothetical protein
VDLVVGPPSSDVEIELPTDGERRIVEGEPEEIWLAIDAKSVMTEHGKARRNRQRDINSFADIMHRHYPGVVTGGVLLINRAERFHSPLRDDDEVTVHDSIEKLVRETVDIFRDIERADGEISPNVDAVGCVVVDHTNMNDGHETRLVTEPPAPQPDEMVHYRSFVRILVDTFEARFLRGDRPSVKELREADRIEELLRRETITLSHYVYLVNQDLGDGNLDSEQVEALRQSLDSLESITDSLEEFTE